MVQVFGVLRAANWLGPESSGLHNVVFEDRDGSHSLDGVQCCKGDIEEGNLMVGVDMATVNTKVGRVGVVPQDRDLNIRMVGCSSIL